MKNDFFFFSFFLSMRIDLFSNLSIKFIKSKFRVSPSLTEATHRIPTVRSTVKIQITENNME